MEFSVNDLAAMLGGEVKGNGSEKINMLGKIQDAKNMSNLNLGSWILDLASTQPTRK